MRSPGADAALALLAAVLAGIGNVAAATPQVAASGYSSFVIDSAGQLLGWGDDGAGQLASGRLLQSNALQALPGFDADRFIGDLLRSPTR